MTITEFARMGGHARAAALTPEQRKAGAKKARLSGLVNAVSRRVDELTEEQKDQLLDALLGLGEDEDGAA
jgi:enoyl-CoA hydratase/carnithine racemase